ncbi:circumsporozoite protein-like [Salvia hispanica]|uniref:circumsporozoite protein-like n=1 Tax=Salvia hispanica TaxID=49212 RepID=UPI002009BDF7|nr:circumsporozoite protein-like [Salvia hispanica]
MAYRSPNVLVLVIVLLSFPCMEAATAGGNRRLLQGPGSFFPRFPGMTTPSLPIVFPPMFPSPSSSSSFPNFPRFPGNPFFPSTPQLPDNPSTPNAPQFPGNSPLVPNAPQFPGNSPLVPNAPEFPGNPSLPNAPAAPAFTPPHAP